MANASCFAEASSTIAISNDLSATAVATAATCSGGNNGSIVVTPSPAGGTYQYSINGGVSFQASNSFTNVAPGSYTVQIKNANNCLVSTPSAIVVAQINDLGVTASTTPSSCLAGSTGTITATATPAGMYQYSINGGSSYQNSNVFNNVAAGNYTVTIRAASGCTQQATNIVVAETNDINATVVATKNATCSGNADGEITVTLIGSLMSNTVTYALDNGAFGTSNIISAAQGMHTVTIKSTTGCTRNYNVTVGFTDNFVFNLSDTLTKCEGVGKILDATSNFTSNTSAVWSPAIFINNETALNPITTANSNIKYFVTATYGLCQRTDSVYIVVNNKPIVEAGEQDTVCVGASTQLNGSITGGAISSFAWSPATYLSATNILNPTVTAPLNTISYVLTATDSYGCNFIEKDTVKIVVVQPFNSFVPDSMIIPVGIPTLIPFVIDSVSAGLGITSNSFTYLWSPASGLNNANAYNPLVTLNNITPVKYIVKATLGDCSVFDTVLVKPYLGPTIYMPTAFVPNNGRGVNNFARPTYVGIKELKAFNIYNRWGQLVFSTRDMLKGWDGNISGAPQPTQTFIVIIEAIDVNGKPHKVERTLTLIR
jgi:gliding motility-associated-like protein